MNSSTLRRLGFSGLLVAFVSFMPGCSVVMEATRPAPVRLAQFNNGESRDEVIAKLGAPITTTTDADGASCDLYSLVLSGYGAAGKASIAFGEVVADVFTLGIAEAVATPTEAATRNKKTPVWFCYRNNALARVTPKKLEGEDLASSTRSNAALPSAPVAGSPNAGTPAAGSSSTAASNAAQAPAAASLPATSVTPSSPPAAPAGVPPDSPTQ
ncbi:MAG: hypothetical protein HY269_04080 [Deltaproteobacteria bacterium]|nr:hypothetical protein [Deltaproteobacteria bacterium]